MGVVVCDQCGRRMNKAPFFGLLFLCKESTEFLFPTPAPHLLFSLLSLLPILCSEKDGRQPGDGGSLNFETQL